MGVKSQRLLKTGTDDNLCGEDKKIRRLREQAIIKKKRAGLLEYRNKKYNPRMCERVIDMMKDGMSRLEVAVDLGVTQSTLDRWERDYPDFSEAIHLGEEASQAWWEKQARRNLVSTGKERFNNTLWSFNMKNRFGWSEISKVEETRKIIAEVEEKKQEIERTNTLKHTAGVLEVLRGVGMLQSRTDRDTEAETE